MWFFPLSPSSNRMVEWLFLLHKTSNIFQILGILFRYTGQSCASHNLTLKNKRWGCNTFIAPSLPRPLPPVHAPAGRKYRLLCVEHIGRNISKNIDDIFFGPHFHVETLNKNLMILRQFCKCNYKSLRRKIIKKSFCLYHRKTYSFHEM